MVFRSALGSCKEINSPTKLPSLDKVVKSVLAEGKDAAGRPRQGRSDAFIGLR